MKDVSSLWSGRDRSRSISRQDNWPWPGMKAYRKNKIAKKMWDSSVWRFCEKTFFFYLNKITKNKTVIMSRFLVLIDHYPSTQKTFGHKDVIEAFWLSWIVYFIFFQCFFVQKQDTLYFFLMKPWSKSNHKILVGRPMEYSYKPHCNMQLGWGQRKGGTGRMTTLFRDVRTNWPEMRHPRPLYLTIIR